MMMITVMFVNAVVKVDMRVNVLREVKMNHNKVVSWGQPNSQRGICVIIIDCP